MNKIMQIISKLLFSLGYEIHKIYLLTSDYIEEMKKTDFSVGLSEKKPHNGCGAILMRGWVNAEMKPRIKGGVLRLSFAGLEQVLANHYPSGDFDTVYRAKIEAYAQLGHLHFYSREELRTVSEFIDCRNVAIAEYGQSEYDELCSLETWINQRDLNTIFEIIK